MLASPRKYDVLPTGSPASSHKPTSRTLRPIISSFRTAILGELKVLLLHSLGSRWRGWAVVLPSADDNNGGEAPPDHLLAQTEQRDHKSEERGERREEGEEEIRPKLLRNH